MGRHRALWKALALTFTLAGCQCGGTAALRVEVTAEQAAPTLCVTLSSAQGEERSAPIDFSARRAVLAVYPSETLSGELTLTARAYAGQSCSGVPVLESDPVQARFPERGVENVSLVVSPLPPCDDCADARCAGRPCDDGNACTLNEVCGGGVCGGGAPRSCTATAECRESTCDPASGCVQAITPGATCSSVTNGICLADGTCAQAEANCANGTDDDGDGLSDCEDPDCVSRTCRDKADSCDVAERCVAGQLTCPADTLAETTVVCRGAAGPCDAPERCTGASAACPADAFDSTSVCRAANGACDTAEQCTGAGIDCPADTFADATTVCRAADGACDVAETCSGASAQCPNDAVAPAATPCRASAGDCDVTEVCSGDAKTCPSDTFASSTVVCRAATGECDQAEACTGADASCPADGYQPSGVTCGTVGDGYACNGAGNCVPSFTIDPTNWDPEDVPGRSGSYLIPNGCNVIFDTSPGAFNPDWCVGGPLAPEVYPIPQPGGPEAALIALRGLTIEQGGSLTLVGTRPLIIAVYGDATVSGTVDASANGPASGPGAVETNAVSLCATGQGGEGGNAVSNVTNQGYGGGGGGGGGGGFGTPARAGGTGSNKGANSSGQPGDPGLAGTQGGADTIEPLRSGCAGGKGGNGDGGSVPERAGGAAGGAGGALQFSVARELLVTGTGRLLAVGGGGQDAPGYNGGGGGGGSGGSLLLEAESLIISAGAILTVTGGGGGEGAGEAANNLPGDDGGLTAGGLGGNSNNGKSGPGGNGGKDAVILPVQGGNGGNSVYAGGGGGGGAAGRIRLNGVTCDSQGTYSGTVRTDGGCS